MRKLNCSTSGIEVYEDNIDASINIIRPTIILNLTDEPIVVLSDKSKIEKFNSKIISNCDIYSKGSRIIEVNLHNDNFFAFDLYKNIELKWDRVSKLLPDIEYFKTLEMYKSQKDKVGNFEINLWFLKRGSLGRIHKEHNFSEIHLQVNGVGVMKKYENEDRRSVFEAEYLAPGRLHNPFFSEEGNYPFHSYDAISDCVWMAIEEHM